MKKRSLLKGLLAATFICTTVVMGAEGPAVKGNPKSKVYHKPACRHYTAKNTTVEFKTEAEARQAGYKACKQCGKSRKKEKPAEPKKEKPATEG